MPLLSEKDKRIILGGDAEVLGHGGVTLVSKLSGVSRPTIILGKKELNTVIEPAGTARIRRAGGGRKKETVKQAGLENALGLLMEPITRGHPESVLMWTCVSTRNLALLLKEKGYDVSYKIVGRLLSVYKQRDVCLKMSSIIEVKYETCNTRQELNIER